MNRPVLFPANAGVEITVIDCANLDMLNLSEFDEFRHALNATGVDLNTFADWLNKPTSFDRRLEDTVAPRYEQFREAFREAFRERTGIGLMLEVCPVSQRNAAVNPVFVLDEDDMQRPGDHVKRLTERLTLFKSIRYPEQPTPKPETDVNSI